MSLSLTPWQRILKALPRTSLMTLLMLSATLLMTACTPSQIILPDTKYLQPCPITYLPSKSQGKVTNERVARTGSANVDSLNHCNDDKEALRAWRDSAAKSKGK